jgi:cation-transporting ATPase 13A3/4/5
MFDGVASEIIPSSITSFHHHHNIGRHSIVSDGASGALSPAGSAASSIRRGRYPDGVSLSKLQSNDTFRSRSRSRSRSIDARSHFRFFDADAIVTAQGTATLDNPEDPVDYDTNWDNDTRHEYDESDDLIRRQSFSTRAESINDYGSTDRATRPSSISSYAGSYRDRIPSEVSNARPLLDFDENSESDDNDSALHPQQTVQSHAHHTTTQSHRDDQLNPAFHENYYPNHPSSLHFQRFYIAEEDLVLGIAGYKTSRLRMKVYQFFCIISFGLIYLLLRWLPRYKFAIIGVKVPLAKAEWVIVETEYGELNVIPVTREWYNRSLSTVMNVPQLDDISENNSSSNSSNHQRNINSDFNPNIPILISFEYRYLRLFYSPVEDIFKTNTNWCDFNWLNSTKDGLSKDAYEDRLLVFRSNSLELKEKSISSLLVDEVLHPFYMFQVFSIVLWAFDAYYYYAGCIFLISIVSIVNTLMDTKATMARLRDLSRFQCNVRVWRNGFWKETDSTDLVPGDIYEISDPSLSVFPCDSLLLSGDCIVNESMLTGESVPVSKLPANESTLNSLINDSLRSQTSPNLAKSFLYNGTKIIRVRHSSNEPAMALVVKTGFSTTKGSLLRSMLFPKPTGFKFYEDSFKYIGFMTCIAFVGFIFSTYNFLKLGLDYRTIILRALDIITIVVPPALPATLTIGTSFALSRLKSKNVYCIAPTRVNIGGKLDVLCFDKTGTLTEEGLDVYGVHFIEDDSRFSDLVNDVKQAPESLVKALVSCHSLRVVDGELIGDPLDFKMFEFTGWNYEEEFKGFISTNEERFDDSQLPENDGLSPSVVYPKGQNDKLLGILRSFEFISQLRRMSVIIKSYDGKFSVLTKGAPEVIKDICDPSSFPNNYEELLHHYTHSGYRVIALAGKKLKKNTWLYSQKITREEAESDLKFLGFIVFENRLKPTTTAVLKQLSKAKLRTVMCTGDNLLTAVSVAKECGLVKDDFIFIPTFDEFDGDIHWREINDENLTLDSRTLELDNSSGLKSYGLAISGDVFKYVLKNESEKFSEEYITKILLMTNVFARMSPDEKHEMVEQLQDLDYTVGFCGDGANDCGALKAADVGISLSEAEASVAAPFTSRVFDIGCVLDVIREGRASLVTSFSCFQYMSLYSAIQFVTVSILYKRGSNLGDFQFLWIDLFLILPIAIFMSWSNSYKEIVPKRPSANLVSPKLLIPLTVNILLLLIFQVFVWQFVQSKEWYIKPIPAGDDAVQSSDNTVLFFFSNFQYIFVAIILTVGPPYREPITKNIPFLVNIGVATFLSVLLMNLPADSTLYIMFQLTHISTGFKFLIFFAALANLFLNNYIPPLFKELLRKKESHKKYKRWLKHSRVFV